MPIASPGPQVGGGTGSSNSSRQMTVGLSVLKMMYQPYGAAITPGNLAGSYSTRRPAGSAPKTPNCAETTSIGSFAVAPCCDASGAGAEFAAEARGPASSGVAHPPIVAPSARASNAIEQGRVNIVNLQTAFSTVRDQNDLITVTARAGSSG